MTFRASIKDGEIYFPNMKAAIAWEGWKEGNEGARICGNFTKLRRYKTKTGRPRDPMRDYKAIVPYFLKWRHKIGKVECDCTEQEEHYMPYYGPTWFHMESCALLKQLKTKPHLKNLWPYQILPGLPIDYDVV